MACAPIRVIPNGKKIIDLNIITENCSSNKISDHECCPKIFLQRKNGKLWYIPIYVYTVYWVLNVTIKDCDFPNEYDIVVKRIRVKSGREWEIMVHTYIIMYIPYIGF